MTVVVAVVVCAGDTVSTLGGSGSAVVATDVGAAAGAARLLRWSRSLSAKAWMSPESRQHRHALQKPSQTPANGAPASCSHACSSRPTTNCAAVSTAPASGSSRCCATSACSHAASLPCRSAATSPAPQHTVVPAPSLIRTRNTQAKKEPRKNTANLCRRDENGKREKRNERERGTRRATARMVVVRSLELEGGLCERDGSRW